MIITQGDGRFWAVANLIPLYLSITLWDIIFFRPETPTPLSNDYNTLLPTMVCYFTLIIKLLVKYIFYTFYVYLFISHYIRWGFYYPQSD